jgi:hypothetical protein
MAGIIPSGAKGIFNPIIDHDQSRAAESDYEATDLVGGAAGAWLGRSGLGTKATTSGAGPKPACGAP